MIGTFRSTVAWLFLALAAYFILPVSKPSLWLLEEWGGFHVPVFVWPTMFLGAALALWRACQPQRIRQALFLAFVLLGTLGAASFLTLGPNALTLTMLVLAWHCMALNLRVKGAQARGQDCRLCEGRL